MSIPVEIPDLAAKLTEYGWAYLLTVRESQRPHIVAVSPVWDGDDLVTAVGRGTGANAAARPEVTLCFPPPERDGFSLIVDGAATVDSAGTELRFRPTGAVLHRPAVSGAGADAPAVGEARQAAADDAGAGSE